MTITGALGWALIHFLWQGSALALGGWLLLRIMPSTWAAARYWAAVGALALMPVALAVTTAVELGRPVPRPASPEPGWSAVTTLAAGPGRSADPRDGRLANLPPPNPGSSPTLENPQSSPAETSIPAVRRTASQWLDALLPWLVIGWLAGVLALAARYLTSWRAARRLVRTGVSVPPLIWQQTIDRLIDQLGIRRSVTLLVSGISQGPAVVGWLRPVILIPMAALAGLTPAQVELLLAHELAHVRRFDYLVNVLQCAVEALLFYHPGVWWLSGVVRREREHCCDDLAAATRGDPLAYAEALVAMEELRRVSLPLPALGADGGRADPNSLLARVRRLVEPESRPTEFFPRWIAGALLGVGLLIAMTGVRWAEAADRSEAVTIDQRPGNVKHEKADVTVEVDQEPRSMRPDTVIRHPDPNAPLSERFAWARSEGRRYRNYWIGYAVAPVWADGQRTIYLGRNVRLGGKSGGITISGRMINIGDPNKVDIPGVRLYSLVGGRPDDVGILVAYAKRVTGERLDRVQASSLALPVDFERRPLLWLGRADDDESIGLIEQLRRDGGSEEIRTDLVNIIGLHRASDLVVPRLTRIMESSEPEPVREAATESLGYHAVPESVVALARAARSDRSADIRREAAETLGEVDLPEAFDSLVALARTLEDHDARREAVEAFSERKEPAAVSTLVEIARNDRSSDIRREAVETLGDFPDHRGARALLDLVNTLEDTEARREAVETIAEALEPAEAVAALERIAREDKDQDIRREAAETLGEVDDPRAATVLIRLAEGKDQEVAREAVEALGESKRPGALEAVTRLAESAESEEVRREAVETLGESEDPAALEEVARLAETAESEEVRREAVESYGESAPPKQAAQLLKRLIDRERSETVQHEILEALAELDNRAGLSILLEIAKSHPDRRVRRQAISQLGEMDDDAAQEALVKIIEK
jgi:HEAT repeat protein/beta-lactamase regulating signal transducer with metallopeptidase domain